MSEQGSTQTKKEAGGVSVATGITSSLALRKVMRGAYPSDDFNVPLYTTPPLLRDLDPSCRGADSRGELHSDNFLW